MAAYRVLYNPKAASKNGEAGAKKLESILRDCTLTFQDITQITDFASFLSQLTDEEELIVSGGDGTLNHFANDTDGLLNDRKVYYWPSGTGNDFLRDIEKTETQEPVDITEYLQNLPTVTVNGMTKKFLNGIGYGIDGYCCEVGDKLASQSDKPVNYAGIAIKGLLFHYNPTKATVTADGTTQDFKNVWLAPTMLGRFYGGGMMPTPAQNRLAKGDDRKVSCMVWHNRGRLSTLMAFPAIFKGEHINNKKMIDIFTAKKVNVKFDRPVALQIDGETVLNVTEYTVNV